MIPLLAALTLALPPPVKGHGSGAYQLRLAFYHADGEPTRRAADFRRDGPDTTAAILERLQKPRTRRRG